jgi:hypothetical protein
LSNLKSIVVFVIGGLSVFSLFTQISTFGNFLTSIVLLGTASMTLLLSSGMAVDTSVTIYENEQWQASQRRELSAELVSLMDSGEPGTEDLNQQISLAQNAAERSDVNFNFSQETLDDGSLVIVTEATGQGFDTLNELFFGGKANISTGVVDGQTQVTIRQTDVESVDIAGSGGSYVLRIEGGQIIESNTGQIQLGAIAIWQNPIEIQVTLTEASAIPQADGPSPGAENGPEVQPAEVVEQNLIKNGDFEKPWEPLNGVAPDWVPYHNGQAFFGWYDEQWLEAVHKGEHAQLMEIDETEADILDRVIAIHQTVDVVPNSEYQLTIYAIMRTDAPAELRNKSEYEMHWGIDKLGEGNYDNVEEWVHMPLTEQLRIGSNGTFPEDIPLFYERISDTVRTGPDTNRITLFIRGLKKFPTGTEVNFDVDDVSLVGPAPGTTVIIVPAQSDQSEPAPTTPDTAETSDAAAPAEESSSLPQSGATLTVPPSLGTFLIGGLILIVLGATATASLLLKNRKEI